MAHHLFRARTVMVGKEGPMAAYQSLMKVMNGEGQVREVQLKRRYEKPTMKRRRIKYEAAQRTYNESMKAKVAFLLRTEREEYPWS